MVDTKPIKVVFSGGEIAGKSCLLAAMKNKEWTDSYLLPRDTDSEPLTVDVDGENIQITLTDLGKVDDYKENSEEFYPDTGVFMVCFDLSNKQSL